MKHLIVIPAFNEQDCLTGTVTALQRLPSQFELLVVDDGSTDHTAEVAERLAEISHLPLHIARLPFNCGIGAAVQTGYLFAAMKGSYHYVVQFDGDGQHDAASIPALVQACEDQGLDLCIGSRFLNATADGFRSTHARRIGIRFFARLITSMTGSRVTDPTSGLRCVGPRTWRRFAQDYPDDYPEPESLAWCGRNGLRIGEIPVRMFSRLAGSSSIRPIGSVYYMIKVTLAILVGRLRRKEQPE